MIYNILLLLFSLCLNAAEDKDPIVVHLEGETRLLPLYASSWNLEKPELSPDYLQQLESILRFDLGHNGGTFLVKNSKALDTQREERLSEWQKAQVFYLVKTNIQGKKLSVRLLQVNSGTVKALESIPLTGSMAQDRKKMHHIADTLYKELFGKEGVASTRFIYTLKTQQGPKKWQSDLWEADYDGAHARQILKSAGYSVTPVYFPSFSGKLSQNYLFVSYLNGQPKIYIGSVENEAYKRLTPMRGNQLMPAISRQRDKIAFVSDITGNPDLFVQAFSPEAGAVGKPHQIFAAHKATQGSPCFSPDGKQIAFVSNKDGAPRIYLIKIPAPGTSLKEIKAELISKKNRESTAPAWSPDGSKLAYSAMTNGVRQIWIYDFEKKNERQLTAGVQNKENPTWAPNSLHLIYNSTGNGNSELYLINLNQPEAVKISSGSGEKRFPNWQN